LTLVRRAYVLESDSGQSDNPARVAAH
jgi:hypothetical protein